MTVPIVAFRVHLPKRVNVKAIRRQTGLGLTDFARRFCFAAAEVRSWEQGRVQPEQTARLLLLVIAHNPDAVADALAHRDVVAS